MTNQEIFDRVVEMLKARNWARAGVLIDNDGDIELKPFFSCRYRSPVGPCAVGLFITDEEYTPGFEGLSAKEIIRGGHCKALEGADVTFLGDLQEAHDGSRTPQEMKSSLIDLARDHELNAGAIAS